MNSKLFDIGNLLNLAEIHRIYLILRLLKNIRNWQNLIYCLKTDVKCSEERLDFFPVVSRFNTHDLKC